jgi:serine/threonine protein kinase/tetratricopeptide (TPR) repeat protein
MERAAAMDHELLDRLPLPLAQLYLRAQHAKNPLERHLAGFYLWEASLRLLASVAVIEYAGSDRHVEELDDRLRNLARPALGHWWEFVRRLVPVLAEEDEHFRQIRDLLLGRQRDDLPAAAGLDAALREVLTDRDSGSSRSTVRLTELFDCLVNYRNREIGHGAAGARNREFYDRMARALLGGLTDIFRQLDVLAGRRLVYVADVRRLASGRWLVERFELQGPQARRMPSLELSEARTEHLPHTERLYLAPPGADETAGRATAAGLTSARLLHPLLLYEADSDEVYFLNGRQGQRKVEYLGYTSGKARREVLAADQRELLARVLGAPVDEQALDHWAQQSLAEDPPAAVAPVGVEPRRIGEFELLSRIGQGGMGTVYRAWQPSLGRQVALKRLIKFGDPKAQQRFQREIRVLGSVEHPHLVKIFTSGSDGDDLFFAMELIEGTDLGDVCRLLQTATAGEIDQTQWQAAVSTACQQSRTREHAISESRRDVSRLPDTARPPLSGGPGGSESHARAAGTPDDAEPAAGSAQAIENAPTDGQVALDKSATASAAAGSTRGPQGGQGYIEHAVEILRQVAHAAHALHEHGVVHRDIKPGNIMLTEEGHAVLMDLGLAQLADDAEGRMTRTGQFVGTVRYASPEQLLSVARLDRRSDVYSLGATLWELLTLRPLFGADDQTPIPDLMLKVQSADPEKPRRANPRIPVDLEAIVLKCLEKDRSRRYATAADLAEDLARWQRGEPVLAQPQSLGYVLGKYVRRHVGQIVLAAALLLLAVAGTAAAFVWVNAARREAETANRQLREMNDQLQEANQQVGQARDTAQQQANLALRTLEGVIFDLQRKLDRVPGAQQVQRSMLERTLHGLKQVARSAESAPAVDRNAVVAHHDLGDIFFQVGGTDATEQARQQYARALEISQSLAAADPNEVQTQRDLAVMHSKMGNALARLGASTPALDHYQKSLAIRNRLALADPTDDRVQRDVSIAHSKLGDMQLQLGATDSARQHYQQAVEIRQRLATAQPDDATAQRDLAITFYKLGELQLRLGATDQARGQLQNYMDVCQRLSAADPADTQAQDDLAMAHSQLGDLDLLRGTAEPARQHYQQSLGMRERLAAAAPADAHAQGGLAMAHLKLGDAYWQLGSTEQAREHFQKYRDLADRLAARDPGDVWAQRHLATAHAKLGDVDLVQESTAGARQNYEKYQEICTRLAAADPDSAAARWELAAARSRVGDLDLQQGAAQQALEKYQQAREASERLAGTDPQNAQARLTVAIAHFKLGDAHFHLEATAPARECYQKYLEIVQQLAAADSHNAQLRLDVAIGSCKLGQVCEQAGEHLQTQRWHGQGLEIIQRLEQEHCLPGRPDDAGTLFDVACSYGRAIQRLASQQGALSSAEQAQLQADYTDKALAALRYAVALGYRKVHQLQREPSLQPLHDAPGYQEILSDLQKTAAAAVSPKSSAP